MPPIVTLPLIAPPVLSNLSSNESLTNFSLATLLSLVVADQVDTICESSTLPSNADATAFSVTKCVSDAEAVAATDVLTVVLISVPALFFSCACAPIASRVILPSLSPVMSCPATFLNCKFTDLSALIVCAVPLTLIVSIFPPLVST